MTGETLTTYARDGLTFDVLDGGPRDGDAVVLLHGFPQDATCWRFVAPRLHEAGLRTLAPHQRGYSPGATPAATSAYALSELVSDVLALIDAAGLERVHLVGHDWGGTVAWATALAAPERLRTLTVLSTPHPVAMSVAMRSGEQARRSWYMGAFLVPVVPEQVLSRQLDRFFAYADLPPAHRGHYVERFSTPEALRGPLAWYRANVPAAVRGGAGGEQRDPLVRVPTTYVWGRRDVAFADEGVRATRDLVAADYRVVGLDASHWLPEVEAERVAEAIIARTGQLR